MMNVKPTIKISADVRDLSDETLGELKAELTSSSEVDVCIYNISPNVASSHAMVHISFDLDEVDGIPSGFMEHKFYPALRAWLWRPTSNEHTVFKFHLEDEDLTVLAVLETTSDDVLRQGTASVLDLAERKYLEVVFYFDEASCRWTRDERTY